jgi:hypothetical protein
MEQDAIILDYNGRQGEEIDVIEVGVVRVVDDGLKDDKKICSTNGKITAWDRIKIEIFFNTYTRYKKIRGLIKERRIPDCRYLGTKTK